MTIPQDIADEFRQLGHPNPEAAAATLRKVEVARAAFARLHLCQCDVEELHEAPVAPGMVFRMNDITAVVNSVSPRIVWDHQGRPSWQVMATPVGSTPGNHVPFSLVHGFFSLEPQTPGV